MKIHKRISDMDEKSLALSIINHRGYFVEFENGCLVALNDDNGVYWGTSPYGSDWCCNSGEGYELRIINWLNYWNESRTENGSYVVG